MELRCFSISLKNNYLLQHSIYFNLQQSKLKIVMKNKTCLRSLDFSSEDCLMSPKCNPPSMLRFGENWFWRKLSTNDLSRSINSTRNRAHWQLPGYQLTDIMFPFIIHDNKIHFSGIKLRKMEIYYPYTPFLKSGRGPLEPNNNRFCGTIPAFFNGLFLLKYCQVVQMRDRIDFTCIVCKYYFLWSIICKNPFFDHTVLNIKWRGKWEMALETWQK